MTVTPEQQAELTELAHLVCEGSMTAAHVGRLEHLLRGFHALYDLPMTLVTMAENAGYAAATNAGAGTARGERLLLLNSDVVPVSPGWLPRLDAVLDRDPRIGAVGPKLLFDDGSIQHAGLYFARWFPERRDEWIQHLRALWEQGLSITELSGEEEQRMLLEVAHEAGVGMGWRRAQALSLKLTNELTSAEHWKLLAQIAEISLDQAVCDELAGTIRENMYQTIPLKRNGPTGEGQEA